MVRTLVLALAAMSVALAQQPLPLRGVVTDPSGARVPGVKISVLATVRESADAQPVRRIVATSMSGSDGSYSLEVPPTEPKTGIQAIAEAPGFAAKMVSVWRAPGGSGPVVRDFALSLGQITETIEVAGTKPAGTAPAVSAPAKPQRIRVGGNVQAARLLRKTSPEYPKDLQEKGAEGVVELDAVISREGNTLSVRPRSSAVHQGLVDTAVRAVQTWQYQPTLLNGEPVEVITTVTVSFVLR